MCVKYFYGTGEHGEREDRPTCSVTSRMDEDMWKQYAAEAQEAVEEAFKSMRGEEMSPSGALRTIQGALLALAMRIEGSAAQKKREAAEERTKSNETEDRPTKDAEQNEEELERPPTLTPRAATRPPSLYLR